MKNLENIWRPTATENHLSACRPRTGGRTGGGQAFLRIAVSAPVKETYIYAVPEELRSGANVGCRVMAPFRSRKITGFILEKTEQYNGQGLKEILEVLDPEPLFCEHQVPFLEWMADYYIHPIGKVIQSALPGGLNMNPFKTAFLSSVFSSSLLSFFLCFSNLYVSTRFI